MSNIFYALFLFIAFYLSIFNSALFPKIFLAALLICPALMFVVTKYLRAHISATVRDNSSIMKKGVPFTVEIDLVNTSRLPAANVMITLSIKNGLDPTPAVVKLRGMVDTDDEATFAYTLTSSYCGRLHICVEHIAIFDYFGLFYLKKKDGSCFSFSIQPNAYSMNIEISTAARTFIGDAEEYDPHQSGDDVSEIFDVREYQKGDRLQKVHWKLSAKNDTLMVKEYSRPLACNIVVLLDMQLSKGESFNLQKMDAFIETVASISTTLIEQQCAHYIAWYNQKTESLQRLKIDAPEDLYELFSGLFVSASYSDSINIRRLYGETYPSDTYFAALILNLELNLNINDMEHRIFSHEQLSQSLVSTSFVI